MFNRFEEPCDRKNYVHTTRSYLRKHVFRYNDEKVFTPDVHGLWIRYEWSYILFYRKNVQSVESLHE